MFWQIYVIARPLCSHQVDCNSATKHSVKIPAQEVNGKNEVYRIPEMQGQEQIGAAR